MNQEFIAQAKLETEQGLPVATFMQNLDDSANNVGLNQRGFIDFVCIPLFESVFQFFPKKEKALHYLHANRMHYDEMAHSKDENEKSLVDSSSNNEDDAEGSCVSIGSTKSCTEADSSKRPGSFGLKLKTIHSSKKKLKSSKDKAADKDQATAS